MDARSKRREATRRQLEQQLRERQAREARRKRAILITSVVGTVAVVALVVVLVVVLAGGSNKSKPKAGASSPATSATPTSSAPTTSAAPVPVPTAACATPPKGSTASFAGLTITGTTNLKKSPVVSGKQVGANPTTLRCEDLVVGSGAKATTASTGTVEYVGLVYKTGKVFQTSWTSSPATFGLAAGPNGVIAGFSQGIAGAGKVVPMRVGGRRVILMPASVAYGATPPANSGIPANADLVFIVDLQKVT